jgi:hypothetical protein
MDRWLLTYVREKSKRGRVEAGQPVHVLLCLADHFEPDLGNATPEQADARVRLWVEGYPRLFGNYRDSGGRCPRHTFFYPMEVYDASHLDALAGLCAKGFGEVEVHLHHDGDSAAKLRDKLLAYKELLATRHKLLARDRHTGEIAYGFIHGNWALDNSLPDGRWCGVTNELEVLRQTGCYGDFTLPAAPSAAQTRKINSIYYARGKPGHCKSHDWGADVGLAPTLDDALLLVQGPLMLDWTRKRWGCIPRVENGCLQGNQLPSMHRLELWLQAHIQIPSRPDWFFVKLHTHGCNETNQPVLLGEPMSRFHESLAEKAQQDLNFHYHYVTAREMVNLVKAAEAGWTGSVVDALNYQLVWNGSESTQFLRNNGVVESDQERSRKRTPNNGQVLTKVNVPRIGL